MPRKITVQINSKKEGDAKVETEFTDEEWSRLISFASEADRLKRSIGDGLSVNFTVRFVSDGGVEFAVTDALSEDRIALLLHRIRPFVLQQSDPHTYLLHVISLLCKRIDNDLFRGMLDRQRKLFDGRRWQETLAIAVDDVVMNSDTMLQKWLNSSEYHRDAEKQEELDRVPLTPEFLSATFQFLLIEKVRAILNVAHLIRAMEQRDGVPVDPEPFRG